MREIVLRDIKNYRITRVILGAPFSADITAYIDPNESWNPADILTGDRFKWLDLDGDFGVLKFFDLPDGYNMTKVESLIKAGYTAIKREDGQDLSWPIRTTDMVPQWNKDLVVVTKLEILGNADRRSFPC